MYLYTYIYIYMYISYIYNTQINVLYLYISYRNTSQCFFRNQGSAKQKRSHLILRFWSLSELAVLCDLSRKLHTKLTFWTPQNCWLHPPQISCLVGPVWKPARIPCSTRNAGSGPRATWRTTPRRQIWFLGAWTWTPGCQEYAMGENNFLRSGSLFNP